MKKLMIALGVVAVAAAVQASSFQWKVSDSTWQCLPGDEDNYFTGTAYFFDAAAVSQQAALDAFNAGTFGSLTYLSTGALDDGEMSAYSTPFSWGSKGETLTGYYATLFNDGEKDYLFISNTGSGTGSDMGATSINITGVDGPSALPASEATTFGGTGWYTQAVPEPTSGLLLLLGVAGLALKRKRA